MFGTAKASGHRVKYSVKTTTYRLLALETASVIGVVSDVNINM